MLSLKLTVENTLWTEKDLKHVLVVWSWYQSLCLKWVECQRLNLKYQTFCFLDGDAAKFWGCNVKYTVIYMKKESLFLSTLSVCLRRVVAGLPWLRSHKITVSSAEALANTFLRKSKNKYFQLHTPWQFMNIKAATNNFFQCWVILSLTFSIYWLSIIDYW